MADNKAYSRQYDNPSFPSEYLKACCRPTPWVRFEGDDDAHAWFLKELYNAFQRLPDGLETLLDFGAGPSIINAYMAAPKFKKIILAEYAAGNREELLKWHRGGPDRANWRATLVDMMAYGGIQFDAVIYETLPSLVKGVIPCDILQSPILPATEIQHSSQDCVVTTLALESGATTVHRFQDALENLMKYLKPGGYMIVGGVCGQSYYTIGDERLLTLEITKDEMVMSAQNAGSTILSRQEFAFTKPFPQDKTCFGDTEGFLVFKGQKKQA